MTAVERDVAISFRDVAAGYADRAIWQHVNVEVRRGEFVAVLGPNGVGKSTFVRMVLGLATPITGEVRVLGGAPGSANARIGYLPQRRNFDASVRVRGVDIVRLGLDGDRWGVPLPFPWTGASRRDAEARVRRAIDTVGASAFADRPIGAISGGEQQRLLIAQALVRDPDLLVLDEPLDSLDLPSQAAVAALLGHICAEDGVTVLLVAHNVNPILGYLDRVVYLAHGGAASGTPTEVITAETLSRLYDTPMEVLHTADGHVVVVGQPEAPHGDAHAHLLR